MRPSFLPVVSVVTSRTAARALLAAALASGLASTASCGTDDSKTTTCVLSFEKSTEKAGDETIEVGYRASFSEECKQVYSGNTGRSQVTLQVTAKGAEGMYVKEMIAGERNVTYGDKKGSLAKGNLQSSFGSDFEPSWAFPWPDAPATASVSMVVPKDVERDKWPSAIAVEFAATGG